MLPRAAYTCGCFQRPSTDQHTGELRRQLTSTNSHIPLLYLDSPITWPSFECSSLDETRIATDSRRKRLGINCGAASVLASRRLPVSWVQGVRSRLRSRTSGEYNPTGTALRPSASDWCSPSRRVECVPPEVLSVGHFQKNALVSVNFAWS